MPYYWTDPDLTAALEGADALEIAGVADLDGETMERLDGSESEAADLFSVYAHKPGQGSMRIADRDTYDEAILFANCLSSETGLRIVDRT